MSATGGDGLPRPDPDRPDPDRPDPARNPMEVRVPSLGQSAETAVLVSWAIEAGSPVLRGDVVAVVETDKTEIPVEAPADGVLGPHQARPGDELAIGTLLCVVLDAANGSGAADAPGSAVSAGLSFAGPTGAIVPGGARGPVSPRARLLARERGIDPGTLVGSGPAGLVVERDVPEVPEVPEVPGVEAALRAEVGGRLVRDRLPLSPLRRTAVKRLTRSWTSVPHFVQMVDVDGSRLARRLSAAAPAQPSGPSVTDAVVAATARALAEHPDANARYDDGHLVRFVDVHVGIALDTERGLMVAVIRDADRLSLPEITTQRRRLVEQGRAGRLGPDDIGPASATVSNLGAWGIRAGIPVLNEGEAMLVFVGELADRVVALDGRPAVRPELTLSIAFDHRVLDGAAAAALTTAIKQRLESDPFEQLHEPPSAPATAPAIEDLHEPGTGSTP